MPLRKSLAGLGLLAGLALAVPAWAQQQPNLTALHNALHLTAEQEGAWSAYKAAVVPSQSAQNRRRAAAQLFPTLPAPRRIDLVEAEMQQDLADLRRQAQALKAFYSALSPAQQRTFDQQTLPQQGSGREDSDD
jgi:hypothetical protein